jgi:hypothetical protein
MREVLMALGVVGLLGGAAVANEGQHRIRLDRGMFDQIGPKADTARICGPAGARSVENRRSGGDVVLTFLTVGFYTPTHVTVTCNTPDTELAPVTLR